MDCPLNTNGAAGTKGRTLGVLARTNEWVGLGGHARKHSKARGCERQGLAPRAWKGSEEGPGPAESVAGERGRSHERTRGALGSRSPGNEQRGSVAVAARSEFAERSR